MIFRFMFFRPFIIYFFTFFLFSTFTFAQNDKKVIINGNEDIDDEVIFSIIGKDYDEYNDEIINQIIKKLYDTGNFKKIEVQNNETELIITILENPKIDKVKFEGNKRFSKEIIFEQFNKNEYFNNLNENNIELFISELTKLYNSFGYNLVKISYATF